VVDHKIKVDEKAVSTDYTRKAREKTSFVTAPTNTNINTTKPEKILIKDFLYIDSIKGKNLEINSCYEMSYENAKFYVFLCNIGKFSWDNIEGYHVPYILRVINGVRFKYIPVRMAETHLLKNYLNFFHADMFTCTSIKSYFISDHEAKLLNEINKYSDYAYGKYTFKAGKDLIVTLEDAQELYTFMDECYKKLLCQNIPGHNDKCGFIQINSEPAVPYCIKDGKQFLPIFYFEGSTESLMSLAVKLENWELAYLKFCFKVQGIKNELFNSDSCETIDLDSIKRCYSSESSFQQYWPSILADTCLVANQNSNHVNLSGVWVRPPLEVVHNENTIPRPLIEPAALITQSIPKIQNTYQNGWPANKLV